MERAGHAGDDAGRDQNPNAIIRPPVLGRYPHTLRPGSSVSGPPAAIPGHREESAAPAPDHPRTGLDAPGVHAFLYDAGGEDRPIDILQDPPRRIRNDQLLWVDVVGRDRTILERVVAASDLLPVTADLSAGADSRPLVRRYDTYLHVVLASAEPSAGDAIRVVRVDLIAAPNLVITVRDGDVGAFQGFREEIEGATRIGRLDTASFTAALVDAVLGGYLLLVEDLERRVDVLDEGALRSRENRTIIADLAALRARAALLRRALAPHRGSFAALARPDFALHEGLGSPWPGLLERLDTVLAAIEAARELLLGTFELVTTRIATRTNDTVKTLTILSAVLLPASLVSSVMGMNFDIPLFRDEGNFGLIVLGMFVLMAATLALALARDRQ